MSVDVLMAVLDDSPWATKQSTLANRDGATIGQIGTTFGIPLIFHPLNSSKEQASIAPPRTPPHDLRRTHPAQVEVAIVGGGMAGVTAA
jgi:hypothetical protein